MDQKANQKINDLFCVQLLPTSENCKMPIRKTEGSAGYDICSIENKTVEPWSRSLISTGIKLEILNKKYYAEIKARSGLSLKGIDIGAGIIDNDYRGIIKVVIINNSNDNFIIKSGDSIAQLIFRKFYVPDISLTQEITQTKRAENGFGSTDKK